MRAGIAPVEASMTQEQDELKIYCRQCGGERYHSTLAEKTRNWSEDEAVVQGGDTWSIVECGGCRTVTFVHEHWFSEDEEYTDDDGPRPIVHCDLYPPSPLRKKPEWGSHWFLCFSSNDLWIGKLLSDVYSAAGMKAYSLAAMGARAIVDHIVTSKAGDKGSFVEKLTRICEKGLITKTQVDVIAAAFDAGSAAAHRGYSPTETDLNTLLDITESLLQQIYVDPMRQSRQAAAVADLKSKLPPRVKQDHGKA